MAPEWSFDHDAPMRLVSVAASHCDQAGVVLKVETRAPDSRPSSVLMPRPSAAIAVVERWRDSGAHARDPPEWMRSVFDADHQAVEVPLQIHVDGELATTSAVSHDGYLAGRAQIGDQHVTISVKSLSYRLS